MNKGKGMGKGKGKGKGKREGEGEGKGMGKGKGKGKREGEGKGKGKGQEGKGESKGECKGEDKVAHCKLRLEVTPRGRRLALTTLRFLKGCAQLTAQPGLAGEGREKSMFTDEGLGGRESDEVA